MNGASIGGNVSEVSVEPTPHAAQAIGSEATEPNNACAPNSIESLLLAWVKSVEKDTETQVQEYLEQVDAGQSGE